MAIKVFCDHILQFDKQAGEYVRCQHRFLVADDLVGQRVDCPQCGHDVAVPLSSPTDLNLAEELAAPEISAAVQPPDDLQSDPLSLGDPLDLADYQIDMSDDQVDVAAISLDAPAAWSSEVASPPIESSATGSSAAPSPLSAAPTSPTDKPTAGGACTKCGEAMDEGRLLCEACGYHEGTGRYLEGWNEKKEPPTETGFRLWLSEQLSDGESLTTMLYLGWGVGSLIGLFVASFFITLLGWWSAVIIYPLYLACVVFSFLLVIGSVGKRDTRPTMLWAIVLVVARLVHWRSISWPFRPLRVGDFYRGQINDEELLEREGLSELEVLDLEGTKINDQALETLRRSPNLCCLVLRRTHVTAEAVGKLQKARPEMWIWH